MGERSRSPLGRAGPHCRIYATLGEREEALQLLERAYEERAGYLPMLHVRADLIPLRGDPRFAALARKLGLAG